MQRDYEKNYHKFEKYLWWFRARRELILRMMLPFPKESRILEVGCSGGVLLQDLARAGYKNIEGIDISEDAVARARGRGVFSVRKASAESTGAADESIDVLIAADILEHIENEEIALREWRRIMKPNGTLFIMVPAFMTLWSGHDLINEHKRRYRRAQFIEVLHRGGFAVQESSYWNFLFFFPTLFFRTLLRIIERDPKPQAQLFHLPKLLNGIMLGILRCENILLGLGIHFPVGVSIFARANKDKVV